MTLDLALPIAPMQYEKRIVVFFDVLGWRNQVERAGNCPSAIARLNALVQLLSTLRKPGLVEKEDASYLATFSDNVVFSKPYVAEALPELLSSIAKVQLGACAMGFYIRGAITVGDLHHNNDVVFGPALIRAYDLERIHAKVPRIVLDPLAQELKQIKHPLLVECDQLSTINAFSLQFVEQFVCDSVPEKAIAEYLATVSWQGPFASPKNIGISGKVLLAGILQLIEFEITRQIPDDAKKKLEWLKEQIRGNL